MIPPIDPPLGATRSASGITRFHLWAPTPRRVELLLEGDRSLEMPAGAGGYRLVEVPDLPVGSRYGFRLDGGPLRADPASRAQPDGVEAPSAVVAVPAGPAEAGSFRGHARDALVLYELHVGTFSPEGTFAGVVGDLDRLAALGITALELLPVAAFPGRRNWGYDGVFPFAVQESYGGIAGLRALARACHARGLSLLLDVVYNHLGPEGNHLAEFGPYFTDRYRTPWGAALNFDGPGSDEVRRYFVESARYLLAAGELDGLRVDAVHAIVDPTAQPFLADLTGSVHALARELGRPLHVIAESALNDPRVLAGPRQGGLGFDASWNDDLHHALHVLLTGERSGYYEDFRGRRDLAEALVRVFVRAGGYSPYRRRRFGAPAGRLAADRFVVFAQNHDQVGNRPRGERLSVLVSPEALRLAAAVVTLSPYLPLLFMGEEYGERRPFLYFTDHRDPALQEAVRAGRAADFPPGTPAGSVPDPQDPGTFERSRLDPDRGAGPEGARMGALYRSLLALRRELGPRPRWRAGETAWSGPGRTLWSVRPRTGPPGWFFFQLAPEPVRVPVAPPSEPWVRRLDAAELRFGGPGPVSPERLGPGTPESLHLGPFGFAAYTPASRGGA